MPLDFSYGDEVTGENDGVRIPGVLVGLDYAPDDSIRLATIRIADGSFIPVDPASLQFAVDKNGFSFSHRDEHTLVIRRNDLKLTNPQWWRRRGLKLLMKSIAPKKKRRR